MATTTVVECFKVIKDGSPRFFFGLETTVFGERFPLEIGKKALALRIVVTMPLRAHALAHVKHRQVFAELSARILAPSVRVKDGIGLRRDFGDAV